MARPLSLGRDPELFESREVCEQVQQLRPLRLFWTLTMCQCSSMQPAI